MKSLSQYIAESIASSKGHVQEALRKPVVTSTNESLKVRSTSKLNTYNYHPKTKNELEKLIDKLIKERGNKADLNDIDTSEITNMSRMFFDSRFNGDISNWDVSNVTDMHEMFCYSMFNGDISNWDVSNVKDMDNMFEISPLKKNPPKWYSIKQ